jgi:hypothetical protein
MNAAGLYWHVARRAPDRIQLRFSAGPLRRGELSGSVQVGENGALLIEVEMSRKAAAELLRELVREVRREGAPP